MSVLDPPNSALRITTSPPFLDEGGVRPFDLFQEGAQLYAIRVEFDVRCTAFRCVGALRRCVALQKVGKQSCAEADNQPTNRLR
mgnify:CR=1 FL=1